MQPSRDHRGGPPGVAATGRAGRPRRVSRSRLGLLIGLGLVTMGPGVAAQEPGPPATSSAEPTDDRSPPNSSEAADVSRPRDTSAGRTDRQPTERIQRPRLPIPSLSSAVQESREAPPHPKESRLLDQALGIPESSDFSAFGWIENGFTGNPGMPSNGLNFGVNPNNLANQWMGNQYYLVLTEKLRQDDTINFGFRVDALFGNDWQFNHMQGLLDRAFRLNSFLGFDPAQFYLSVHLPILTPRGLDIIGGRWYTIAGFEGVPALSRPLQSVAYMFNYGQPFTHFGMLSTLHLSEHLDLFNGTINGWDRWVNETYRWGYIGGLSYTSEGARNHFALTGIWGPNQFPRFLPANQPIYPTGYINIPSLAGLPNPGYNRDDRTLLTWVFSHEWSKKLVQTFETDQGWERSIPGLASHGRNYAPQSDAWGGLANWFLYKFNEEYTGVWRAEWFRDVHGARTGFPGNFYEMTLGLIITPKPWLMIRPEIRLDWSQFSHPYDNGTSYDQLTLGLDAIIRF